MWYKEKRIKEMKNWIQISKNRYLEKCKKNAECMLFVTIGILTQIQIILNVMSTLKINEAFAMNNL